MVRVTGYEVVKWSSDVGYPRVGQMRIVDEILGETR